ncbi:8-amino-3,8-dideoxy-manno-octulosonate cytidylyltransferase [Leucobacter aridicollis]|uniref:Spore coat polysaccharide biosynthesis protein SpsF n=1 Tax=Leucobacter aridicollis TaxID=283878 RepID=A0A852RAU6_9MICO|nr:glycosyltransferase family protein [Leucobacter aridicollis]MBL3681048.1 spore coat protein [Leucobacter aridicollis]MCS3429324.1 spore coat polysaccharide biosynthesis protein SpsF [Leucobacter aridicollis]NYD27948.1 spore coat polysaccharide biosynthesis protein SpsF [Leucobacter aridicollis]
MILGILQARSSSSRFPRKVLEPLLGKEMILRQLERLARSKNIDRLVVATSEEASDDQLALLLATNGWEVRRGPLDDVLGRFARVIAEFEPDQVVRLTADCPLADPGVIDRVIDEHLLYKTDYTSNVLVPTFPHGLDVEVFSPAAFARLADSPLTASEREHVTLGMYRRTEEFTTWNVQQGTDHSDLRWTVDVPEDFVFVERVYEQLYASNPEFGQDDVLKLLAQQPSLSRTAADLPRNVGLVEEK